MDQGVFALIAYPERGDLQRIPEAPPEQNGSEYAVNVHLQARWDRRRRGRSEILRGFQFVRVIDVLSRDVHRARSLKAFEERVTRYVSQASFRKASISGTEDNRQQITEKFSFAGNFATASTGDSWFFQPLILSGIAVPEVPAQGRASFLWMLARRTT